MDGYAYWREELAAPKINLRDTERRDICGFYRCHKAKTKPDYPIAIWSDNSLIFLQIGRAQAIDEVNDKEAFDRFFSTNWYHASAITEELYRSVMAGKGWWPDGKPAWAHADELEGLDPDYLPASGGNIEGESFDTIKADIERNIRLAHDHKIVDQDSANEGRRLQDVLNKLHQRANEARVKEKRPHDDASAAVQAKWMPIVEPAKRIADWMRNAVDQWLKAEQRRLDEEAAAERRRVEAENERIANEHAEAVRLAERKVEALADAGEFLPEPELPPEPVLRPAPMPAPVARAGTAFGAVRKARTIVTGEIVDQAALLAHLVEHKDVGLLEYLQNRANAAAKAKFALPGVVRREN